jgi:uncharacterized integral membrane protein
MGLIRGTIFFLLLLAGIGFAILNDQSISLKYYFGWVSPPIPLFLWAFLFLLLGFIISGIWAFLSKLRLYSRIRQRKKTITELEEKRSRLKEERASH